MLENLKQNHEIVITLEDGILDGGFGEKIARFYSDTNIKVKNYGIKKAFYDKYNVNELLQENKKIVSFIGASQSGTSFFSK